MYHFATLDPRPSEAAAAANDAVFASATAGVYGVEVTIPALAERCALGNLDPQHSGGKANVAACVAALTCTLPPGEATLVTVRPDADSVAAMAILNLRATGLDASIRTDILTAVAAGDCAATGAWKRNYRPPAEFRMANAIAMDWRTPLVERVVIMQQFLLGNPVNVQVPPAPEDSPAIWGQTSPCGRYAVVLADGPAGRGGVGAGYRMAPIVIAVNEAFTLNPREVAPHRKYTVARWNTTHVMDWDGMLAELRDAEPGWGGSSSICGSPQGTGSRLSLDQVREIVERHLPA